MSLPQQHLLVSPPGLAVTLAASLAVALLLFSASPCPSAQRSFRSSPTALSTLIVALGSLWLPLSNELFYPILQVWMKASWQGLPMTLSSSSSRPSHTPNIDSSKHNQILTSDHHHPPSSSFLFPLSFSPACQSTSGCSMPLAVLPSAPFLPPSSSSSFLPYSNLNSLPCIPQIPPCPPLTPRLSSPTVTFPHSKGPTAAPWGVFSLPFPSSILP